MDFMVDPNSPESPGLFESKDIHGPELKKGEDTRKPTMGKLTLPNTMHLWNLSSRLDVQGKNGNYLSQMTQKVFGPQFFAKNETPPLLGAPSDLRW